MSKAKTVIVMPIYEDHEASSQLFVELKKQIGTDVFIVAVDDGSVVTPVDVKSISDSGLQGAVIRLKRNLGHQRAIAVGLSYVAHNLPDSNCIVMDSDGEDTPESVSVLIEELQAEEADVIVATRKSRVETLKFKAFYVLYRNLFLLLTGKTIAFGNFMAMTPKAVKRLSVMQELWIHVAASVIVSKLQVKKMPLARGPRYQGKSKMNFGGLVLHGFRALMVFAEDVLVRVGIMCAIVATVTLTAMFMTVILKLTGFATPGWFSIALAALFIMLLQIGALTLMTLMLTGVMRGGECARG